jgi:hypothetical protein
LIGKNKADTMGAGMLNFNIEGSGRLAESNKQYSNADLKKMFKTKEERESFLKRNKSISMHNSHIPSGQTSSARHDNKLSYKWHRK